MMNQDKLDLLSLTNAIKTFKKGLDDYQKDNVHENKDKEDNIQKDIKEYIRDACIKRFEYCYELSKKFLKRHLKNVSDDPSEIESMELENLIRLGAKKGLLSNSWDVWNTYRKNRNEIVHGYDEDFAIDLVEKIPDFLSEAEYLLQKLKEYYET